MIKIFLSSTSLEALEWRRLGEGCECGASLRGRVWPVPALGCWSPRGRTVRRRSASGSPRDQSSATPGFAEIQGVHRNPHRTSTPAEGGLGKGLPLLRTERRAVWCTEVTLSRWQVMVRERWDGWHRDSATARGTSGEAGLSPNLREKTVKSGALGEGRREGPEGLRRRKRQRGWGGKHQGSGREPSPHPHPHPRAQ